MDMRVPEAISPMEVIAERKAEILRKLKNGDVEPAFMLGGNAYTMNEWEQLLERIDKSTENEGMEDDEVMDPYVTITVTETENKDAELESIYERMMAVSTGVQQTLNLLNKWVGASAS